MRLFAITLAALLGLATRMEAQTFLQHIQQHTKDTGTVTVVQSKDIDELVNNTDVSGHRQVTTQKTAQSAAQRKDTKTQGEASATKKKEEHSARENNNTTHRNNAANQENQTRHDAAAHRDSNAASHDSNAARPNQGKTAESDNSELDMPTVDMRKKMPRRSYKVNGYRVQVFAGGNSRNDKMKAQEAGNKVKMAYPELPVYVHFYSPRWICRVGNFRSYEEANIVLKRVRNMGYKQACIVSGKITVAY